MPTWELTFKCYNENEETATLEEGCLSKPFFKRTSKENDIISTKEYMTVL